MVLTGCKTGHLVYLKVLLFIFVSEGIIHSGALFSQTSWSLMLISAASEHMSGLVLS